MKTPSLLLLPISLSILPLQAASTISVNFAASMSGASLAGAVERVGNWNNINAEGAATGLKYADGSAVGGGFSVDIDFGGQSAGFATRAGGNSNDALMFKGVIDVQTTVVASVTNIPYTTYDVYAYMYSDGTSRTGGFTIGSTTYYVRGFGPDGTGNLATDGTGYVRSTDTTAPSNADTAQQGSYVLFSGLTGSTFDLTALAADGSTGVERNKWSGFQIVEAVPEPSTGLLSLGTIGLLLLRRRR